jgi:ubiquitin-like-conjugating enzyme ATG3
LDEERIYDVYITFDNYELTPRLWLNAMSAEGQQLSPKDIFDDIMAEYADKTATIEEHK